MTRAPSHRGHGLIGLLIVVVCIFVMFVIGMNALNKGVTGQGSVQENTVRSMEDKFALVGLFQSLAVDSMGSDEAFVVPSALTQRGDRADDTTASLFSVLIAQHLTRPELLISGNEYNPGVYADPDYDYTKYQPRMDLYWDPAFEADLDNDSNVSFAHLPLYGDRFDRYWRATMDSTFPLLGNRGPAEGRHDPNSYTYGRDGTWAGHVVFGDGHVEFLNSLAPGRLTFERDRQRHPDNIFAMEDGPEGGDAVLSFTREMTDNGPELQHD